MIERCLSGINDSGLDFEGFRAFKYVHDSLAYAISERDFNTICLLLAG